MKRSLNARQLKLLNLLKSANQISFGNEAISYRVLVKLGFAKEIEKHHFTITIQGAHYEGTPLNSKLDSECPRCYTIIRRVSGIHFSCPKCKYGWSIYNANSGITLGRARATLEQIERRDDSQPKLKKRTEL